MNIFFKIATKGLLFSIISFSVHASNYNFLTNSAISFFTKEDLKLSKSARDTALNQNKDGVKLVWKNPKTGSHGTFMPMHTIYANGSVCRDMKILQSANYVNEKSVYRFCKMNDEWKIV